MDLIDGQLIDNIMRLGMTPSMAQTNALLRASGIYAFCKAQGLPTRSLRDALVPVGYYGPTPHATHANT